MTQAATQQDEASQEVDNIEALFAEASGTPGASAEGDGSTTTQPVVETKDEAVLDQSQNTVSEEATDAASSVVVATEGSTATPAETPTPASWRESLTTEAKAEIDKIEAERAAQAERIARLEHAARSDAGRVAALTRSTQELQRRVKEVDTAKASNRDALLKQLKADYPQIAEALEAAVGSVEDRAARAEQQAGELAAREATRLKAEREAVVETAHKGWKALIASREFGNWFGQQPTGVQALGASSEPGDAIALLDRYRAAHPTSKAATQGSEKQEQGNDAGKPASKTAAQIKAEREAALRKSAGPATRPATRDSTNTVPDETDAAFDHFAQKRDKEAAAQSARR